MISITRQRADIMSHKAHLHEIANFHLPFRYLAELLLLRGGTVPSPEVKERSRVGGPYSVHTVAAMNSSKVSGNLFARSKKREIVQAHLCDLRHVYDCVLWLCGNV